MVKKQKTKIIMNPFSDLYTTEQAAEMLQISTRTILRAIEQGRIKAKRVGRGYRITKAEIENYVQGAPDRFRPQ